MVKVYVAIAQWHKCHRHQDMAPFNFHLLISTVFKYKNNSSQLTYLLLSQFSFICKNVCTLSCKYFGLDVLDKAYSAATWCMGGRSTCIELNGQSKSQLGEHIVT